MTKTNRNDRRESRSAAEYALYTGQFAEALRTSIARSGFSLQRLSAKLLERGIKVSPAALSYWQSGSNRPERDQSLRAVGHLERSWACRTAPCSPCSALPGREDAGARRSRAPPTATTCGANRRPSTTRCGSSARRPRGR